MYLKFIKVSKPLCTSFSLKLTLQKIIYSSKGRGTGCGSKAGHKERHSEAGIKAFLAFFISGISADINLFHFFKAELMHREGIKAIQSCL